MHAKSTAVLFLVTMAVSISTAFAWMQPKVSKEVAGKIALQQAPGGIIKSSELEQEKGALVWSFDISRPGTRNITEVLVNAETGAVVEVSTETPAQQRSESRADAKEATGK